MGERLDSGPYLKHYDTAIIVLLERGFSIAPSK